MGTAIRERGERKHQKATPDLLAAVTGERMPQQGQWQRLGAVPDLLAAISGPAVETGSHARPNR